jgi:ribonuclease T1
MKRVFPYFIVLLQLFFSSTVLAASCDEAVQTLNARLPVKIDPVELVDVLNTLNKSNNQNLPVKFIRKNDARDIGWKPGKDLWKVPGLHGRSIGGDYFGNREKRLPTGKRKWREADLDYKGGHRGAKRLLFSNDGLRMVTVDHYQTFVEVPSCR